MAEIKDFNFKPTALSLIRIYISMALESVPMSRESVEPSCCTELRFTCLFLVCRKRPSCLSHAFLSCFLIPTDGVILYTGVW